MLTEWLGSGFSLSLSVGCSFVWFGCEGLCVLVCLVCVIREGSLVSLVHVWFYARPPHFEVCFSDAFHMTSAHTVVWFIRFPFLTH
jgi:hypothetical protein